MTVIHGHALTWLSALLLVGGLCRALRLVIDDQWPGWYQARGWLLHRWKPGPGRYMELLVCPWCLSVWLGTGEVVAWWFGPRATLLVCLVLTLSAVASLIAAWTGD